MELKITKSADLNNVRSAYIIGDKIKYPSNWNAHNSVFNVKLLSKNLTSITIDINNKIETATLEGYVPWLNDGNIIDINKVGNINLSNFAKIYIVNTEWTPYFLIISPNGEQAHLIFTGSGRPVTNWLFGNLSNH